MQCAKKMKKWIVLLFGLMVALGIILNWAWGFFTGYDVVLNINWGITLPKGYTEIYGYSEPSVHGDGTRYHVLDYPFGREYGDWIDRIWTIERLFDQQDVSTEEQLDEITSLLEGISVEDIPDFSECPLITQKQQDNSRLYLVLDHTNGIVYIVEFFC